MNFYSLVKNITKKNFTRDNYRQCLKKIEQKFNIDDHIISEVLYDILKPKIEKTNFDILDKDTKNLILEMSAPKFTVKTKEYEFPLVVIKFKISQGEFESVSYVFLALEEYNEKIVNINNLMADRALVRSLFELVENWREKDEDSSDSHDYLSIDDIRMCAEHFNSYFFDRHTKQKMVDHSLIKLFDSEIKKLEKYGIEHNAKKKYDNKENDYPVLISDNCTIIYPQSVHYQFEDLMEDVLIEQKSKRPQKTKLTELEYYEQISSPKYITKIKQEEFNKIIYIITVHYTFIHKYQIVIDKNDKDLSGIKFIETPTTIKFSDICKYEFDSFKLNEYVTYPIKVKQQILNELKKF